MAGPSIENWVDHLGLKEIQDPDIDKPVYRKPYNGAVPLNAEVEDKISTSIRVARDKRSLSRSKIAPLLGLSDAVYQRYETSTSRLTVLRLIHICEVLGATPEELLAPAAPHLWGDNEDHSRLMRDTISQIRQLDHEGLEQIYKLLASINQKASNTKADR
ncbi:MULTISPECIES: helix-turn-helix domain-containing protein [Agrobacterium]|uniref:helix-turn-helix domain-containing protein n=1 Tax=Agrobacterium TaxID=357 RepID=UPI0009C59B9F|nr:MULTISPECIES: helix-turn-helix transcriptional regulator [Agrobacterium]CUX72175.1 conserved hypothetical protein [Agrobacterium sp. NCPPB 925]